MNEQVKLIWMNIPEWRAIPIEIRKQYKIVAIPLPSNMNIPMKLGAYIYPSKRSEEK